MLAESLCSILLLEESSPRQVFTEFLLARKAALQEVFHPCQHGELKSLFCLFQVNIEKLKCVFNFFSLLATSIKSQVCEVVQIIRRSLYQIHALFCGPPEGDLNSQLLASKMCFLFDYLHTRQQFSRRWNTTIVMTQSGFNINLSCMRQVFVIALTLK